MEGPIATQREEVRRLILKYRMDIVNLEEREEDLVRRIQLFENLIPTVLVWYMWKINQTKRDSCAPPWSEDEAVNKLHHLETILHELRNADAMMKREEVILRQRLEDLEALILGDPFSNICVKPLSPPGSKSQQTVKRECAQLNKDIQHKRLKFSDFLEDSNRDWQQTCEELVNEVNTLQDILDQHKLNVKSGGVDGKNVIPTVDKSEESLRMKMISIENRAELMFKEVMDQEKKNMAMEEIQDAKMLSMVQDATDEVDSIKRQLKSLNKEKSKDAEDLPVKQTLVKPTKCKMIEEEEEEEEEAETDLSEANSPVVHPQGAQNKTTPLLDLQGVGISDNKIFKPSDIDASSSYKDTTSSSALRELVGKPSAVEVDTTTDIQLPPSVILDQINIDQLSSSCVSLPPTTLSKIAEDDSVDKGILDHKKISEKSDLESQNVDGKFNDPPTSNLLFGQALSNSEISGPSKHIKESLQPKKQSFVLDSHSSQPMETHLSQLPPDTGPSQINSSSPTISDISPIDISSSNHPTNKQFLADTPNDLRETVNKVAESPLPKPSAEMVNIESKVSKTADSQISLNTLQPSGTENVSTAQTGLYGVQADTIALKTESVLLNPTSYSENLPETVCPLVENFPVFSPEHHGLEALTLNTAAVFPKDHFDGKISSELNASESNLPKTASKNASIPSAPLPGTSTELKENAKTDHATTHPQSTSDLNESTKIGRSSQLTFPSDGPVFDQSLSPRSLQRPGTSEIRYDLDRLENLDTQSKLRVKDHMIKSLADQIRQTERGKTSPRSKLLTKISEDPVKTYDFNRVTLVKYLKGEGPPEIDTLLASHPAFSSSNQLKVEIVRKLDQSSLLIRWSPPAPEEVVGFQIFVNGEFVYWVYSASRNIALLQPLDLTKTLEIAVSPVDRQGKAMFRSSATYSP